MACTEKELAQRLQLSTATISLVMNGRPGVRETTRERVMAEAIRMGYTGRKRERKADQQNIRYVIFLDSGDAVRETSFYSVVLQGIETTARRLGYNVLVSYLRTGSGWNQQLLSIRKDVSGILLLATELSNRYILSSQGNGSLQSLQDLPIVLVDNSTTLMDVDCVVADNLHGARRAAVSLLQRGHSDVGYLRSRSRIDSFIERQMGLRKARLAAGIPNDQPLSVVDVGISSEQAYYDMRSWLKAGHTPLSAYFADNDIIAAACIRALKAEGYRVPLDVSVIGFDDMPVCTMIDPALTTVRIMKEQMGAIAMELLHRRIQQQGRNSTDAPPSGACRVIISTRLVERESVLDKTRLPDGPTP